MKFINLRDDFSIAEQLAQICHQQWGIDKQTYLDSFNMCYKGKGIIPQWYMVTTDNGEFMACCGVIDNDFHQRKDLSPNIVALLVDKKHRHKGVARKLINYVLDDLASMRINDVWLITGHHHFYEKLGFNYCGYVTEDDGGRIRMYHRSTKVTHFR